MYFDIVPGYMLVPMRRRAPSGKRRYLFMTNFVNFAASSTTAIQPQATTFQTTHKHLVLSSVDGFSMSSPGPSLLVVG